MFREWSWHRPEGPSKRGVSDITFWQRQKPHRLWPLCDLVGNGSRFRTDVIGPIKQFRVQKTSPPFSLYLPREGCKFYLSTHKPQKSDLHSRQCMKQFFVCERSSLVATWGAVCGLLLAMTSHQGSAFLPNMVVGGKSQHSGDLERKTSTCTRCMTPWSALGLVCTFYGAWTP